MPDAKDPIRDAGLRWLFPHERRLVLRNLGRWKQRLDELDAQGRDANRRKLQNIAYAWLSGFWGIPAVILSFAAILAQSVGTATIVVLGVAAGFVWVMFILRLVQAFTAYPHNVPFPRG
jgi:hypothetical protein